MKVTPKLLKEAIKSALNEYHDMSPKRALQVIMDRLDYGGVMDPSLETAVDTLTEFIDTHYSEHDDYETDWDY